MTARPTTWLPAPSVALAAWAALVAAGCQLSIEGAPCPCGPGWSCLDTEPGEPGVCVQPYCVFWGYARRADGFSVELPAGVVVVDGYTSSVPPGSDILVTATGTLSIGSGNHRVFVEPYGVVLSLGDDNQVYLREHAVYLSELGERNRVIHEPEAVFAATASGFTAEEQPVIDFLGVVEAPFALAFRDISDRQVDPNQGGLDDYVVREGGLLYLPRARAGSIFVEGGGHVFSIDYSSVAYLQSGALFNAGGKRQAIHYVPGATIDNAGESFLVEHSSIALGLCSM